MTPALLRRSLFAAGVVAVSLLPLLGRALRGDGGPRCAMDGVPLPTRATVRFEGGASGDRAFCCVDCAESWLERTGERPPLVLVTDERSGAEFPAAQAWFVESRIPALLATGSRVHTFSTREDAEKHAKDYGGRLVTLEFGMPDPGSGGKDLR